MMPAKVIGAPHSFLYHRFPSWKEDNNTYMIPPIFKAKGTHHEMGLMGSTSYSDAGDIGESIVYNLLRQLGELKNIGMFVFHGFELKDIHKWNKECKKMCRSQEYEVPQILSTNDLTIRECDFIIFHHTFGVVSLEVKNRVKVHQDDIMLAEIQLKTSHDLVMKLATVNTSEDKFSLPYKKIIALPSTHESEFNRDEFDNLKSDTLLLFADSLQNVESFDKWWKQTLENPAERRMSPENREAYELALSYTLMIRHLSPVTETDCMNELYQSLVSYKYHGKAAHPQILESEFPRLFTWCSEVLKMVDEAFNFGEGKAEKLRDTFMKEHGVQSEKDLRGRKGMKIINGILQHSKYISGNTPTVMDEALAMLLDDTYFLFLRNILRFYNDMRKMWSQIKDKQDKEQLKLVLQQQKFPFLKLESPKDLNRLDRHLANYSFLEGDTPSEIDKHLF